MLRIITAHNQLTLHSLKSQVDVIPKAAMSFGQNEIRNTIVWDEL